MHTILRFEYRGENIATVITHESETAPFVPRRSDLFDHRDGQTYSVEQVTLSYGQGAANITVYLEKV